MKQQTINDTLGNMRKCLITFPVSMVYEKKLRNAH